MAIDRSVKYRCQWQSKAGFAMMLEIIPAGDYINLTDYTVVNFRRSLFQMDFAEFGFDDLPIGMMPSPACSFSFKFDNLPSGLQELLKTPEYDGTEGSYETTTLFTLWSDEGLGGDLIIQYVGAQARTLGNEFELNTIDTVESVQIETFDLIKTILDVLPSTSLFTSNSATNYVDFPLQADEIVSNNLGVEIRDFISVANGKYDIPVTYSYKLLLYSFQTFRTYLIYFFEKFLAIWTRTGTIGSTYEQSVYTNNHINTSLTFYKQTTTQAHTKGTALDETNTYILGHVCTYDGTNYESLGGFFSQDKEGVAEFDSMSTLLNSLAENFFFKFKWKPITEVNGVTGITNINYVFYYLKPLVSSVTTFTLTPKIIGKSYKIRTAEKVFLVAESETPNQSGDNVSLNRVSTTNSNKTDVWSAKFLLHNMPTAPAQVVLENRNVSPTDSYEEKTYPRKLYYRDSGYTYKVHESCVISDGINTKTLDNPTTLPDTNNWNIETVSAWAIETQNSNCLQQAGALYITENWNKRDQCMREFTCNMIGGDSNGSIMPRHVGDVYTLPAVASLGANETSVLLSGKPDYEKGTIDCKFLSLGT